tara:strand:- start:331 stop:951 length:621 start_codon:yes stop_codon:yes gene_type:complete
MFINILLSYFFYSSLDYYLQTTKYKKISKSVNVLINSGLIVTTTTLFKHNLISEWLTLNILYLSIGFYIDDLLINFYNDRQLILKSIHHFISLMGILTFTSYPTQICSLFQTEISNLPFEIRNILYKQNLQYPIINTICIIIFYVLFFKLRVIRGYDLTLDICDKEVPSDCFLVSSIYLLWLYWFLLISWKIFVKIFEVVLIFIMH